MFLTILLFPFPCLGTNAFLSSFFHLPIRLFLFNFSFSIFECISLFIYYQRYHLSQVMNFPHFTAFFVPYDSDDLPKAFSLVLICWDYPHFAP